MPDDGLTIASLVWRAEHVHPERTVVSARADGSRDVRSYGQVVDRARRLIGAFDRLGLSGGGSVASLAWNSVEHLEVYLAVPCSARVLHTVNVRLHAGELRHVLADAGDEAIFADHDLMPVLDGELDDLPKLRHVVVIGDPAETAAAAARHPGIQWHEYEQLLSGPPQPFAEVPESAAAAICHTSGTTSAPKGVVYSQRTIALHTMGTMMTDSLGIGYEDTVLPIVPMFHANAWGIVHAAVTSGARLILAGPDLSGPSLARLIEQERVTLAAGVPTVWMAVHDHLAGRDVSALRLLVSGGAPLPTALASQYLANVGCPLTQAWGMTEMSPMGAICHPHADAPVDGERRRSVGPPVPGVQARLVEPDGGDVAWGAGATGELWVRGPWITTGYHRVGSPETSFSADGWLRTGDVATIDEHGYITIVDRLKDIIKSGGEWISTLALENEFMLHPAVAECAVIATPDEKWGERPVAVVVLRDSQQAAESDLIDFVADRVPKWWLPKQVTFVSALPRTGVGKIAKRTLRDQIGAAAAVAD
jgi:fatty-acyl-CoA synthase